MIAQNERTSSTGVVLIRGQENTARFIIGIW